MPSGGHNAKPLKVLQLEGSVRPNRHLNKSIPGGGNAPTKPKGLGPHASNLWDTVIKHRTPWLEESDGPMLECLCVAWQLQQDCMEVLRGDPTEKNARCSFTAYFGIVNSIGSKFGLSPVDRARLGENQEQCESDRVIEQLLS